MDASSNVAPIIIKRKKVSGGDGHHGGAWKVAYADFVTAMMAFFMLMWLLNATTEKQRKGIADYFAPTISISRVSGGGDGAFGGESVFSEQSLARNGTGATMLRPTDANAARGLDEGEDADAERFTEVDATLMGRGGESMVQENELRHIITRVTDEGLVIELFDTQDAALFVAETSEPTDLLISLARVIEDAAKVVTNPVAVEAHVQAQPVVLARSQVWDLSSARADAMRQLLQSVGMADRRVRWVAGHADREPVSDDTMGVRNNRLEVILLREN